MINWFKKLFNKKDDDFTGAAPSWTSTTFPSMLQSAYVPNVAGPFVRNGGPRSAPPDKLYDSALFDYIVQEGLDKDNEAFIEYKKQENLRKIEIISGLIYNHYKGFDFYDLDNADALKEWLDETMPENHRVYIKMAYGI